MARWDGQALSSLVVFGDDGSIPLLGAYTLEGFGLAPDPVNRMLIRVRGLAVEKPYGVSRLQARHPEAKRMSTTADGSSHQASMPRRVNTNVTASAATTPAATRQSSPIMNSYQNRKNPAM